MPFFQRDDGGEEILRKSQHRYTANLRDGAIGLGQQDANHEERRTPFPVSDADHGFDPVGTAYEYDLLPIGHVSRSGGRGKSLEPEAHHRTPRHPHYLHDQ